MKLKELKKEIEILKVQSSQFSLPARFHLKGIKQAVEAVDKSKIIYGEKGDWGNDSKDFDEWQEILKLLNLTEIHKGEENGN